MRKRSVNIGGHGTSIALEDAFWVELEAIARGRGRSLSALIAEIDSARTSPGNLASALRLFVLNEVKRPPAG
jgi:predicted DNA-binding ribbon-helix-helix protein